MLKKTQYYLAIDQGTTSSRCILYDGDFREVAKHQMEFTQYFPQPGWVEHDPEDIWHSQWECLEAVIRSVSPDQIQAIGITNQRETVVVWERSSGRPVYPAIVWQDRRTADICEKLKNDGYEQMIREKTGLVADAYFSATKIQWILQNIPGAMAKARRGELMCGTIDTWLIYKLTEGKIHTTDLSNASRTMLCNIHSGEWDTALLTLFDIPASMLPEIKNSHDDHGYAHIGGIAVPIRGVAGDQQAALFGQQCFEKGMVKNTYGTGCFMLMNTGNSPVQSANGLLTTVAWRLNGEITYALEGSVFIAGAAVQWLRDALQIIRDSSETEAIAASLQDNAGVYFVPAFSGLGAPYWDMFARGTITGLTRGTGRAHIIRAALEAIAYQTRDVLDVMKRDSGLEIRTLRVDGGASMNNWLMQFQSDVLQVGVERSTHPESTALGAAMLAAYTLETTRVFSVSSAIDSFHPVMTREQADILYQGWNGALQRSRT